MNEQSKRWIRHAEGDSYIFWDEQPFFGLQHYSLERESLRKILHIINLQIVKENYLA